MQLQANMLTAVFMLEKKGWRNNILPLEEKAVKSSLVLPFRDYLFLSLTQTNVENFVSHRGRLALTEGHSTSSVVGRCLPWLLWHLFRSLRKSNSALEGQGLRSCI